jgi:hypothetical protein
MVPFILINANLTPAFPVEMIFKNQQLDEFGCSAIADWVQGVRALWDYLKSIETYTLDGRIGSVLCPTPRTML